MKEYPTKFIAYDLLENKNEDQRFIPLRDRITKLKKLQKDISHQDLLLGEYKKIDNWVQLKEARDKTAKEGAEGLMIKKIDSVYLSG